MTRALGYDPSKIFYYETNKKDKYEWRFAAPYTTKIWRSHTGTVTCGNNKNSKKQIETSAGA